MDTTELQGMMIDALQSLSDLSTTQQRFDEAITREVERLWQDNGALRDDLHALANRLEALTRSASADDVVAALARESDRQRDIRWGRDGDA